MDGYIHELNIIIEFDEKHHLKPCQQKKDAEREENIFQELNCLFLELKKKNGTPIKII